VSNASTVRRQIAGSQQLTIAPLSGTVITTTPTAFQLNNNALTLTGGGVIPLSAGVTGLYAGTGQVLDIRGTGQIAGATGGTTTLALTLYEVPASVIAAGLTPTSFTGWNSVATTGAKGVAQSAGSFNFIARLQLDASGNLEGSFKAVINGAVIFPETVITPITGLVGEADLNFVLVATLAGAEVGVILTLEEFALDLE
jgi:hypothetical protein